MIKRLRLFFSGKETSAGRCADLFLESLTGQPGIGSVQLDFDQGQLTIQYDARQALPQKVEALAEALGLHVDSHSDRCQLRLQNQSCRECWLETLEDRLNKVPGISHVSVNPAAESLSIEYEASRISPADLRQHVRQLGIPSALPSEDSQDAHERRLRAVFAGACALFLALGSVLLWKSVPYFYPLLAFALAYIFGGAFSLPVAVNALRRGAFSVDFLMLSAAGGAATIGRWQEGAILLFLFSLSTTLEAYAMGRTRRAIQALMKLRPARALVRRDGHERLVPVEELRRGDCVIVRPGERLPIDGSITAGESSIDQASITGESLPVVKRPGDSVYASTINQHGSLEIRVTKLAEETLLAKIIQLVEQAQSERAPTQRLIDHFGHYYTFGVVIGTLLALAVPVLLLNQAFQPAFYRAMTLLVVASPCALVISIPAAILAAIANGARRGILFKGGAHLEIMGTIRVIALDKTGTLTIGKPRVTDVIPVPASGLSESELLALAASIERYSEHPLARAIVQTAHERELPLKEASDFQALVGQGVQARLNGCLLWVGNCELLTELGQGIPENLRQRIEALEAEAKTVMLVSDGEPLGAIAVADALRPVAPTVVHELKRLGIERTVMITGDNALAAQAIARQAGIDEHFAQLLPQDKVHVVKQLRERYGRVAMVGDGVNDAPALATATIGIAMGGAGTDVALETADVVLMSDDLTRLGYAVKLSRRTGRIMRQNLIFASLVIVSLISTTLLADLPLPLGVVGHEGSTLVVVLNGLRLLR
jgi:Cd2+/Zn2+-exporting ATPase